MPAHYFLNLLVVQWLRKCIPNLSQSLPMSNYKGEMSPFGTPFKLGKVFTKSTRFVAANYKWTTNRIALGGGVALFSADKKVAVLARVIKISRHKKKEDKVVTVMSEAGHTSKHNLEDLVPVPVPNEFLRATTGEWYKVTKTKAKGISLANVIVPKESHAAPSTANPAPSATPSATPSVTPPANHATQPPHEPSATPSANPTTQPPHEPSATPSATPSQPSTTRSVEFLPDSSAVRPSLSPSDQPPSASKFLYKSQRHGYDRIAVYMIV